MATRISRTCRTWRNSETLRLCVHGLASVAAAFVALAPNTRAQEYGYSYLCLEIDGHPITNFVHNQKYQGWLKVEEVEAMPAIAAKKANASNPSGDSSKTKQTAKLPWTTLPKLLASGRAGAGEITFGAGDEGGLDALFDAQKTKSLIGSAELDLYDVDTNKFIGKYRLKGLRVLSLEGISASACPMYDVTMSFESIEKI